MCTLLEITCLCCREACRVRGLNLAFLVRQQEPGFSSTPARGSPHIWSLLGNGTFLFHDSRSTGQISVYTGWETEAWREIPDAWKIPSVRTAIPSDAGNHWLSKSLQAGGRQKWWRGTEMEAAISFFLPQSAASYSYPCQTSQPIF